MDKKRKYKRITIDEDVYNLLEKFARERGQTKNGIVQDAIITYMAAVKEAGERRTDNAKKQGK